MQEQELAHTSCVKEKSSIQHIRTTTSPNHRDVYTMDNEGQIFKLHTDSDPELVVE